MSKWRRSSAIFGTAAWLNFRALFYELSPEALEQTVRHPAAVDRLISKPAAVSLSSATTQLIRLPDSGGRLGPAVNLYVIVPASPSR